MPTTVATGTTNARRTSVASDLASYAGVRYASALLGSGYQLLVGGKTVDGAGVETSINLLTFFKITATTLAGDGSTRYAVEWRRPTTPIVNAHLEDAQAVALVDPAHAGKVLVCGGHLQLAAASAATSLVLHQGPTPGPELLAVTALAAMPAARGMHRAVVLADGRVLVTGGFTAWPTALASAIRWTPATELWTAAASMTVARLDHAAAQLADGRVVVAGGRTGASTYTRAVEVYDPTGNAWAATGSLAVARAGHALVVLPSGHVLALGGTNADGAVATAELWDPAVGLWRVVGAGATPRARPAAAYVPTLGAVVLAGGDAVSVELWDPAVGGFRASLATLARVRRDVQAIVLPQGAVLLPGGTELITGNWSTTEHSHVLTPGAELVGGGALDGEHVVVAAPSGTVLQYRSALPAVAAAGAGGTVLPVAAPAIVFAGAHLIDPVGPAVTETRAATTSLLEAGRGHGVISLEATFSDPVPTARFPEGGWLVLRLGRAGQVGPVRYLSRLSATDLRLDASFTFTATVHPGDDVTLLTGREAFVPPDPRAGYLYLTASPSGRVAAEKLLDEVAAGGVALVKHVEYSGDRGLGAEGSPTEGAPRLSSVVTAFAGDEPDAEVAAARGAG